MTETGSGAPPRARRATNAPPAHGIRAPRAAKNSEIVYHDLRNDIISMKLAPGTAIVEREITDHYGISRTPVREAVLRLVEERLVDVLPKSGSFVARIPVSQVREGIVARRALEEVTVRAATERVSPSQILSMRAIIQKQQELADKGDEPAFHRADEEFHASIATAAHYPGIWEVIQQMRVQIERYRRLTLPQTGRMQKVVREHAAVVDAMEKGDADKAVACMNEHLDKLQLDIAVFRDLWPDYFIYDPDVDTDLSAR